jgi:pimeloyl-ACP methyl ester carboxylesterase
VEVVEETILVDGMNVSYRVEGSGQPLILLHGMAFSHDVWDRTIRQASKFFTVYAPDLPGFGQSEKPEAAYDASFFLNWLDAFMESVVGESAVVVGNSFGGEMAIPYAMAHPERVRKLVLVSSGGLRFYKEEEREVLREKFSVENLQKLTPAIQEWMFRPIFAERGEAWQRYLDKQNAKLAREDLAAYAVALHRSMVLAFTIYFEDELKALTMPVLLVWGDRDVVFPVALAERALGLLRKADLVMLEGAGHAPQLEDPAGFVRAVQRWGVE